ncbi:Short-chain dehydrogenase/reductase SDR [Penicillium italicum]|uniref:Short-chain dehydrogenase/reductase SDR n=1 Tax=Penicillium italicum TaxID=40296 RepID=A0A0A2KJB7_PENIT|nr:Short-chain dehydrogenase/reductase SDR [Penicillium italicum]
MPRIWFITGSSSGFGRQLAITAAENNDTVIATSRDPSKLSDLASVGVIAKKLDVQASDAEVKAVIDDVESTVGPIDILVNNAGYILEGGVEECSHQEIVDQFDVNVFSQIRILRAALPSMRARKSGLVANFGSIGGWEGSPAAGMYCATKAAVAIYTESLRNELAPFNIEVTCVEPGYFRTNFFTGGHKITAKNRMPELDAGTQATRDALAAYDLHQPGDPTKGAQVLFEAFTKTSRCKGRSLPGRLALGRDSLTIIRGSIAREQEMLDSWEEIIGSTDCNDVQA